MNQPLVKYLKDYRSPDFLVEDIHLDVDLYDDHALVRSRMDIRKNPEHHEILTDIFLNGKDLSLVSVIMDGTPLSPPDYELTEDGLTVHHLPESSVLEITTRIIPRENTSLEGLYMSGDTFLTQCEAEGFRRITYFPDRPDVMSRYSCTITADRTRYPVLLSNGNMVDQKELSENRHRVTWEDPFPKPCYLFALVAGDLACCEDSYTTARGRKVTLKFYVDHGDDDKCDHAMASLKKAMAWDEKVFGLSYDLDTYMIVATHAFNAGAMENKGLNVFNSKYVLARPETATDSDFLNIEGVIAHEYFHNWTGNRVTLNSWFQLSLKEGLTVFRDQEFSSDMGSRAIKRITDVRGLRASQFPEDAGPMAHPIRPESYIEMNNFYTATVYNKGAEVIRMIHTLVGPEGFRKGMDLYFERFDGKAVTTENFVKSMEDASGMDLAQFRLWYSQAGTPFITAKTAYDPATRTCTLTLTQSVPDTPGQSDKKPMLIPIKTALLDSTGKVMPVCLAGEDPSEIKTEKVLHLTEECQLFSFTGVHEKPFFSLLRGFSAPVILDAGYSQDDLMFLMAHDTDAFNRWDASQTLFIRVIEGLVHNIKKGSPLTLSEDLVQAVKQTLIQEGPDKSLTAQILSIPSETELGDRMVRIDVDPIHQAREFLMDTLARTLANEFQEVFDANHESGHYSIDTQSISKRRLKNQALAYLARSREDAAGFLYREYNQAGNMTDALSALTLLADQDHPLSDRAVGHFYDTWKKDTLVLDKWFAVQAGSGRSGTLDRVIDLTGHPDFSITNPNKVRSLIGTFANANPFHFNSKDGKGYTFTADQVIRLNSINASIAARMATAFNKWKRLDEDRQALVKKELERIIGTQGLSKAVFEIVSKALNQH